MKGLAGEKLPVIDNRARKPGIQPHRSILECLRPTCSPHRGGQSAVYRARWCGSRLEEERAWSQAEQEDGHDKVVVEGNLVLHFN